MPTRTAQYISDWLDASDFTTTGQLAYASLIRRLVRHLGKTPVTNATEQELRAFFRSIPSETTRQRAISAASSFFAYLFELNKVRSNPMEGIRFRQFREHNALADARLALALEADGVPRRSIEQLRWADYVIPTKDPGSSDGQHRLRVGRQVLPLSVSTASMIERRFAQFAGDRKTTEVLDHLDELIFPPSAARNRKKSSK